MVRPDSISAHNYITVAQGWIWSARSFGIIYAFEKIIDSFEKKNRFDTGTLTRNENVNRSGNELVVGKIRPGRESDPRPSATSEPTGVANCCFEGTSRIENRLHRFFGSVILISGNRIWKIKRGKLFITQSIQKWVLFGVPNLSTMCVLKH